jgi:DNA-binding transcriptional regulator GbsR (MarR family)
MRMSWWPVSVSKQCLTTGAVWSVISVMTEITDSNVILPEAVKRFVLEWGNLGDRWGVNRSVSQIHALLYASKKPLAAEEIADVLGIARSNVSNSLRELQSWNIIRSVPILGDRRTFYTAETDLWNLVSRIAAGRKARELDPAAAALRECVEMTRDDESVDPVVQLRLREMLDFVERLSRWYDQMIVLPRSKITTLMKLGGGIARLLDRSGKKGRDLS